MSKKGKMIIKVGILLLLGIISLNSFKVKANSDEVFETSKNKVLSISSSDNIEEVKDGFLITNNQQITYIYDNIKVLEIREEYFCHTTDTEYLYLISKNIEGLIINKVNKKTKKIQKEILDFSNPLDIEIIDDELVIVGSNRQDASIVKYDKNLNYLHSYYYGGDGFESFDKIYYYLDDYYLLGSKDAISANSPFLNAGKEGEQKVFLTKINKQGIIIDTVYFNHYAITEELISSDFMNNTFVVNIKANDVNYIYYLNKDLQIVNYLEQINQGKNMGIVSYTNDYLVIQEGKGLVLKIEEQEYDLETKGFLKKVLMDDNVLKVYYYNDYYLWEMVVYEYQILKKEDIIINQINAEFYEKMDMNKLSEIKIKSFIHNLDLQLDSIDPLFNKQIHGTYQATFKVLINTNQSYFLKNSIVVEEYVNVNDHYTYPVGYSLKFSGYALLDDKSIVSGYKIKEEGWHDLVVSDASGNKRKYTFRIINSSYFDDANSDLDYMKPDYVVNKNQELIIKITTNKEVQKIYINNEVCDFEKIEDGVIVKYTGLNTPGIKKIIIDKIEYTDETYEMNKTILVNVLKDAPQVEVKEIDEGDLILKMNISDPDKSFCNLKFLVSEDEKVIKEEYFDYINNGIKLGNIPKDKKYNIKVFMQYDIGNGIINEVLFLDFIVNTELVDYQIMNWEVMEEEINIKFNTDDPNIKINKLQIGDKELGDKYQVVNNYTPLYVSIILSLIVLGIGGFYYFYKKKKQRK